MLLRPPPLTLFQPSVLEITSILDDMAEQDLRSVIMQEVVCPMCGGTESGGCGGQGAG